MKCGMMVTIINIYIWFNKDLAIDTIQLTISSQFQFTHVAHNFIKSKK